MTVEYVKSFKFAAGSAFATGREPVLSFALKGDYNLIAAGDFNGDGKEEIIVDAGDRITVHEPAAEIHKLWELRTSPSSEHVYLEAADVTGDGRAEIIFTEVYDKYKVQSYVYALEGGEFKLLWKTKGFLRVVSGNKLLHQDNLSRGGYDGPVREVTYGGGSFSVGGKTVKLPPGINIYDFVILKLPDKGELFLCYDKDDRLGVIDGAGLRQWTSKYNMGGFMRTFDTERASSTDTETPSPFYKWRVDDKLHGAGGEVMAVKRIPLTNLLASPIFKSAQVINYWWNGIEMEEAVILDDIKGTVLDMTVSGDKIYILVKPLLGFSGSNLLKGENPKIVRLLVYSLKM